MARITIIDDEADIADNMASVLRGAKHTVETLNTTRGAVAKLLTAPPDLIILDVMFPDDPSAGLSLAIETRKHAALKNVPIVMMTAVNEALPLDLSEKDIDLEWMPVQRFVCKPVAPSDLIRIVGQLLA